MPEICTYGTEKGNGPAGTACRVKKICLRYGFASSETWWETSCQRPSIFTYTSVNNRGASKSLPLYSKTEVLCPVTTAVFPKIFTRSPSCAKYLKCRFSDK